MHQFPEVMLLPDSDSVAEDDVERLAATASRYPPVEIGRRGFPTRVSPKTEVLDQEALKTRKQEMSPAGSGGRREGREGGGGSVCVWGVVRARCQEQMGSVLATAVGPPQERGGQNTQRQLGPTSGHLAPSERLRISDKLSRNRSEDASDLWETRLNFTIITL